MNKVSEDLEEKERLQYESSKSESSVQKVTNALNNLDTVVSVEETERFSPLDLKGIDLIVTIKNPQDIYIQIYVQVKSSRSGVDTFLQSRKHIIHENGEIKKICVLNGQQPQITIQRTFNNFIGLQKDYSRARD